jgi:hypothetical protein
MPRPRENPPERAWASTACETWQPPCCSRSPLWRGLGNHTIDQMEPDAGVEVERAGEMLVVARDCMERTLTVSEKLNVAIPLFTGRPPLKGDALWGKFVQLRRLPPRPPRPDEVRGAAEILVSDLSEDHRARVGALPRGGPCPGRTIDWVSGRSYFSSPCRSACATAAARSDTSSFS